MANKPPRPCRYPGCCRLTVDGWCWEHRPKGRRSEASRQWHSLYSTRLWTEVLRPAQLLREPFCRECAKRGLRVRAAEVDHVTPHRGDWALFTDPENLQSLCGSCHRRKTAAENREKFRPKNHQ